MSSRTEEKIVDQPLDVQKSKHLEGYLEAPKKKRRDFVVLAFNDHFDKEKLDDIENYIRQHFRNLSIVKPKDKKDLAILATKSVVAILMDDQFFWQENPVKEIVNIKTKSQSAVPVLFFTEDEHRMIKTYNEHLLVFQEVDSYTTYRSFTNEKLMARIAKCLHLQNKRASKRHKVEIPVRYFHLTDDKYYDGELIDISVHGAILVDKSGILFRGHDQIRVSIPINQMIHYDQGEFLKISAKVRRVLIGGNQAGISWEYLSDEQNFHVTNFVVAMIKNRIEKQNLKAKFTERDVEKNAG